MSWHAARAATTAFCALASVAVVAGVGWALFLWLPARVVGGDAPFAVLGQHAALWLIVLAGVWVLSVGGVARLQIYRLRKPARWRLDAPWSPWRALKSALLIVGWAGVLALYPWAVIDGLLREHDSAPRPAAPALLIGACLLCLILGIGMTAVDRIAVGARSPRSAAR